MKRRFEQVLAQCIEAVSTGQCTVEECLTLYPELSDRLEPLLRLGCRMEQAPFPEPEPAFREAARERFLAAIRAHAAAPRRPRRLFPVLPSLPQWRWRLGSVTGQHRVAAAMTATALVAFLGFSSFVLASSGDSLPGDWRYPVKRLTERTRLTFTFGDDARRDYRISLAEERLDEVQQFASRERQIGESLLRQLVDTTEPLVQALEPDSVPSDQIERITDLTAKQQDVLDQVAPLVKEEAADELEEALVVSSEGHAKAVEALALARSQEEPPEELLALTTPGAGTPTAGAGASPTAGPSPTSETTPGLSPTPGTEASPTPGTEASPVPPATAEPSPAATPTGGPTPAEASPTPSSGQQQLVRRELLPLPDDHTGGLNWNLIVVGHFSVAVPAEENGWIVSSPLPTEQPPLKGMVAAVYQKGGSAAAAVSVTVSDGSASVFARDNGIMREIDEEQVTELLPPSIAEVISHILGSITLTSP